MKRRYSLLLSSVLAILALLLVAHVALPYVIRDYHSRLADVDLALWRGAYRINGLKIVKVNGKVPVPLLDAPVIDSVRWHDGTRSDTTTASWRG